MAAQGSNSLPSEKGVILGAGGNGPESPLERFELLDVDRETWPIDIVSDQLTFWCNSSQSIANKDAQAH